MNRLGAVVLAEAVVWEIIVKLYMEILGVCIPEFASL